MSPLRKVALLLLPAVFALTGCATARVVTRDVYGGVVAIPENSNGWPGHYRDKAMELIKQECPNGYAIVKEGEVVTGTTTTTDHANDDNTMHVVTTRDRTEYRIEYRKASPPTTVVVPPLPPRVPVARVQSVPAVPPGQLLPREPVPVAQ